MKKPNLWAVEDSEEMQKTLRDIFTRLGCEVTVYGNAEDALAKLKTGTHPDVMILDFQMCIRDRSCVSGSTRSFPVL